MQGTGVDKRFLQACGCVSLCPCLGLSGSECLPLNLSSAGCVWVPFEKALGVGLNLTFAFPLVEINQSWESELLAVKTPGGEEAEEEGEGARRLKGRMTGFRALDITACRRGLLTINCGEKTGHPFHMTVNFIIPTLFPSSIGRKPSA